LIPGKAPTKLQVKMPAGAESEKQLLKSQNMFLP